MALGPQGKDKSGGQLQQIRSILCLLCVLGNNRSCLNSMYLSDVDILQNGIKICNQLSTLRNI